MTKAWEIYRGYHIKSMDFWSRSLIEAWSYIRFDERKVSEIEIPEGKAIHVPDPNTAIKQRSFDSQYDWNYQQLEDWKSEMITKWGDIKLRIWVANYRLIRYESADPAFTAFLKEDSLMISNMINS